MAQITPHTLQIPILAFMLSMARLSGFFMNLPGFAQGVLPGRIRLLLTAALSFIMLSQNEAAAEILNDSSLVLWALLYEFIVGYALGFLIQLWLAALNVAGSIISSHTGLLNVFMQGPMSEHQDSLYGQILTTMAVFLIVLSDVHLLLIQSLFQSYQVLPSLTSTQMSFPVQPWIETIVETVSAMFVLSFRLSAPFMILSLLVSIAAGLVNRLMPSFQVFFVTQPLQILLGIVIMVFTLPLIIHTTLEGFQHLIPKMGGARG